MSLKQKISQVQQKVFGVVAFLNEQTREYIVQICFIWSITLMLILSVSGYNLYQHYISVSNTHIQEVERLAYWESVIQKSPSYPSAYYQAAVSSVRLRDSQKALEYLYKALQLDPNFTQAEVFAQEVQKK